MKKRAYVIVDDNGEDDELKVIRELLEDRFRDLEITVRAYEEDGDMAEDISAFFSRPDESVLPKTSPTCCHGWSRIREKEVHPFFVLYVDMDYENEDYRIEELWTDRIESYICSPLLDGEGIWRRFCGNEVSRKRIYIAPVREDNLAVIKSIFKIFLNKQIDDIRLHQNSDVKVRYYLSAHDLAYSTIDSSERLIPACSNIYKLAESLEQDRLYLSEEVIEFLPRNIQKKLEKDKKEGELYSYSFNLLT